MDRTIDILFKEPALGPGLLLVLLIAFKATTSIDPACLVSLPALVWYGGLCPLLSLLLKCIFVD